MIFIIFILLTIINLANLYYWRKKYKTKFLHNNLSQIGKKTSSLTRHYIYLNLIWNIVGFLIITPLQIDLIYKIILLATYFTCSNFLIKFLYKKLVNAKGYFENIIKFIFFITTLFGILVTLIIIISIFGEAINFFKIIKISDFLFNLNWNPQSYNKLNDHSDFGIIPVLAGTLLITTISLLVSVPLGIMSSIYLSFYASPKIRDFAKPMIEILAGIPTVVYGYFAVIFISPFIKHFFQNFGIDVEAESALGAGFVMGIMIIPFISSLTDDALNAVPKSLQDGAIAMGSTKSEMIKKVVIIAAMPNIIGAFILAFSRAIGETMIVTMASGLIANLTINPLQSVTTITTQIVMLLTGDQEFDNPKTLAAFALALTLFILTFVFNVFALILRKKFKYKYE